MKEKIIVVIPVIALFSLVLKKGFDVPHSLSLPIATYVVTGSELLTLTTAVAMLIDYSPCKAESVWEKIKNII